jgi:hypothetical protein
VGDRHLKFYETWDNLLPRTRRVHRVAGRRGPRSGVPPTEGTGSRAIRITGNSVDAAATAAAPIAKRAELSRSSPASTGPGISPTPEARLTPASPRAATLARGAHRMGLDTRPEQTAGRPLQQLGDTDRPHRRGEHK